MSSPENKNRNQLPLVFSSADYVGVSWAAKALNCSRSQVVRYIEEGVLVAHKKGRTQYAWWHIRKDSVIALQQSFLEQERAGEIESQKRPETGQF